MKLSGIKVLMTSGGKEERQGADYSSPEEKEILKGKKERTRKITILPSMDLDFTKRGGGEKRKCLIYLYRGLDKGWKKKRKGKEVRGPPSSSFEEKLVQEKGEGGSQTKPSRCEEREDCEKKRKEKGILLLFI